MSPMESNNKNNYHTKKCYEYHYRSCSFRYKISNRSRFYLSMPVFSSNKKKTDQYFCKILTMDAELQFTIEVSKNTN